MNFIVGGYFLVQGAQRQEWMDKNLIPPIFWTVSRHICETFPDAWVLPWGTDARSRRPAYYRGLLKLSQNEFRALQAEFDELLSQDQFGFPNVLFSVEQAREFYSQYLQHLPNIKLLSIALPEVYWEEFVDKFTPPKNMGESGVRAKLRSRETIGADATLRGFEVFGFEWGDFCSFVCNSLETDYAQVLKVDLNRNGLLNTYEDAVKAAEYTMLDRVGAEPLFWRPWLVSEYPFVTSS